MSLYKNILVAVDLSKDSAMILDRARNLAKQYNA
jgi:nucleotide-binding universal stress UspA family protein